MTTTTKVAILLESDFYEHEIWYYDYRFREAGVEAHFMSRLWGQPAITFTGHEYKAPFRVERAIEGMTDEELAGYAALIVPAGMVSDRLRYADKPGTVPPASELLRRAFGMKHVIKGIICHGLWLAAPVKEVISGRRLVCHNNLYSDAVAYGAEYIDEDQVSDGDLITARSGGHAHLFARAVLERIGAA
jgi:protease I